MGPAPYRAPIALVGIALALSGESCDRNARGAAAVRGAGPGDRSTDSLREDERAHRWRGALQWDPHSHHLGRER